MIYHIWRRSHSVNEWTKTSHSVTAATGKAAQAKVKRKFTHAGFSSMSLLAVPDGKNPNEETT